MLLGFPAIDSEAIQVMDIELFLYRRYAKAPVEVLVNGSCAFDELEH